MAEDVIPPPTPEPEPALRSADAPRPGPQVSYRLRFGIISLALAAIVGAGVRAFIVLATRPAPPEASALVELGADRQELARMARSPTDPEGLQAG